MNKDEYESLPTNSVAVHMTAGAMAGIMEHCVMYPFDSVKTRMQALTPGPGGGGGVGEVLYRMIRQEGVLRPIRGVSAVVVGAGPAHALYFSCYECLKEKFKSTRSQFNHLVYGAAGCVATVLHDGVMNPAEVVKQRLQMYNSPYRNVLNCIQRVYQKEGIFAFYRSYTTQLAMNVPFQSIHFISYEFAQSITNPEHAYNPIAHIGSGAAAGAIAAAATTPLDVCKTVLNTQQDGVHAQGMIDAFKQVYRFGGIQGYFRGLRARVLFQAPATAICWVIYESFKYALRGKQDDEYSDTEADSGTTGINQNPTLASRSNSFQGADIMKPIDPDVRAILYEKGIPTFIATDNYLTERYKEQPENRFYFPDCTNWIYGWRLNDYPPVPLSEVGLKSVMLAQFYQRKAFNLQQDPEWYRGCQKKNARNFDELLTY